MKKIVAIDNYDSFTYNLVSYVRSITGRRIDVFRNDEIPLERIKYYDKIIISPGPGIPSEAGLSSQIIKEYCTTKSILGICLGHQAIAEVFGGTLLNLEKPFHGVKSEIRLLTTDALFKNIPETIQAGRYHSWVVDREKLPNTLEVNSEDVSGQIMGISHKKYDVKGLQFHPESIMTKYGYRIMENWIRR